MKIFNTFNQGNHACKVVAESFLDYLPEGVYETENIAEADVLFAFAGHNKADLFLSGSQIAASVANTPYKNILSDAVGFNINALSLENRDVLLHILTHMKKPSVIFMDKFGEGMPEQQQSAYPHFIQDTDIPCGTIALPPHPNAKVVQFIDGRKFFYQQRHPRIEKSLVLMPDHFDADIIGELLLSDVVKQIAITNTASVEHHLDEIGKLPAKAARKLVAEDSDYPNGVRQMLNRYEYVLHTRTDVGMELMGFEGGFCGARPIYPDSPYYRAHFGNDLGVAYFDTNAPVASIVDIVQGPNTWVMDHMRAFIEAFSAAMHVPKFWNEVKAIIE